MDTQNDAILFKESKAHHVLASMSIPIVYPRFLLKAFLNIFFMEVVLRGLVYLSCLVRGEAGEFAGA